MRPLRVAAAALALAVAALAPGSLAAAPDFPAFTAPVVDAAHVLTSQDEQALDQKLVSLQKKTGIQFSVATVPSLDGEEIEPYANALFRQWKVGKKDVNNGLLLIVAPKEHRLRFEVGYGLEGTMTDLQSKLIITNAMVPKLKAGDTAGAIRAGVDDAIKVLTAGTPPVAAQPADQPLDPHTAVVLFGMIFFVVLLFIVFVFWLAKRRGSSGWTWGAGTGAGITSTTDGPSSGGDSFSGGGGGDSGGGGASGSW